MAPRSQWFGRAFCSLPRGMKQIAFTFDDGPNDPHTFHLLDVLSKHNVSATFFMIGRYVRQRPEIAREVKNRGQMIGNHTFTHPFLPFEPLSNVGKELEECREALTDAVGEHSNLFRPPWGARRPAVFRTARQLGFEPIMWSVTGFDWNAPSAEYIQKKVTRQVSGGDVILLHDGGHKAFGTDRSRTVKVVDWLLTRYKAEGYQFETIPSMMSRLRPSPAPSDPGAPPQAPKGS
ncbi:MAG TPA: polysaccharide deacetylase family protein [Terriglobales bacterium]|nr:polysaccharide deacetylase family protein [Terriglobales bacterium]